MPVNPLNNKNKPPEEQAIKAALETAYPLYQNLPTITKDFKKEWKFYKGGGWQLKIHDGKKALLYLVPKENAFLIGMAIRENEKKALLESTSLADLHEKIANAKKYAEGYAISFLISDKQSFKEFESLIHQLIPIRKA